MISQSRLIYFFVILMTFLACKKVEDPGPVNADQNNVDLNCATCPCSFISFKETTTETKLCDDLTDLDNWPESEPAFGEIIGYTQGDTYPVVYVEGDYAAINVADPGIYGTGFFDFAMSGENQTATFEIYALDVEFTDIYVRVNGSVPILLNTDFPITAGDVVINLDNITVDDLYGYGSLSFTGPVEEITFSLFESGISEVCITQVAIGPPIVENPSYVNFDHFYDHSGTITGSLPETQTPLGFYGYEGLNLTINFSAFLAYSPSRLSFVHAYFDGGSNLINVQLPGTPLLVTIPDSLNYYLEPYGYKAVNYAMEDGLLWQNSGAPPLTEALVDSIIITGKNMNNVTLGANLQESELRSICTYYEQ